MKRAYNRLRSVRVGRTVQSTARLRIVLKFYMPRVFAGLRWALKSREVTNWTYEISDLCKLHMAHAIAIATGVPAATVERYMVELEQDKGLRSSIAHSVRNSPLRLTSDENMGYARRIGWYAVVRSMKPEVVVETGVDKGLGAVVVCAALLKNADDDRPGRYFGTDINPKAGQLLAQPYSSVGEILYGDSVELLASFPHKIDLFINDSDHSRSYERREYESIKSKLSDRGIIFSDNAHSTDVLARFSEEERRRFLFVREQPVGHWYPGAGIGISFL